MRSDLDAVPSSSSCRLRAGVGALTGGGDVAPSRYGERRRTRRLMDVDPDRDAVELGVRRGRSTAGQPVLGICRGIQLMAVPFGGIAAPGPARAAGHQHHWEEERQYEPVHAVDAEPGLAAAPPRSGARPVNSIHHQAVAEPGRRARAPPRGATTA